MNNYLIKVRHTEPSICKFCNERIAQSFLPLILWNKDRIHFIEFHVQCIIKKEKLEEFIELLIEGSKIQFSVISVLAHNF